MTHLSVRLNVKDDSLVCTTAAGTSCDLLSVVLYTGDPPEHSVRRTAAISAEVCA